LFQVFVVLCLFSAGMVNAIPSYGPKCHTVSETVYTTQCSTTYNKQCK
jgi:hypothetical protein